MYIFRLFILSSIFLLMSCGGGGGSSSSGSGSKTSITVNPNSLEFTVNTNSSSTTKPVSVSFKGDGMLVGYPVGSVDPGWLTVDVSESYSSPVSVNIQVHSHGMPAGTHRTTLRFVTGKEDGSNIVYKDLPVTMIVEEGASIATSSLSFTSLESVPSENKTFNISTKSATDWSLSVQYSGTETNWLTLSQTSGSLSASGSTSVTVSAKGLKQGTHTASIILKNKAGSTIDNVNVSYQVNSGVTFENVNTKTITEKANLEDLQWSIPLQSLFDPVKGSTINWTLTSNRDWLKVISETGNLASSPTLQLELDADKLLAMENGAQMASITMAFNDSSITIPLTLMLNIDAKLMVNGYLGFTLDSETTSLQKTVQIGLNVGSAFTKNVSWHVVVQSDWLKVANTTGNTTSQNSLTLQVDNSYLSNFKGNVDSAFISIIPDHPAFEHYAELAALQIYMPQITAVSPYVGFTNQSGSVLITGKNFNFRSKWQIDFDGTLVDATTIDDNTLQVTHPPIPTSKTVKVKIPNLLNIDRSQASLLIKEAPAYSYKKITFNGSVSSMTLDPERQSVLLAGDYTNEMIRLKYDGQSWAQDSFSMPNIQSVELSLDGKEILLSSGGTGSTENIIQIDANNFSIKKATPLINDHYNAYSIILPMAHGETWIIDSDQWAEMLSFPAMEIFQAQSLYRAKSFMSRDRSRSILMGDYESYIIKSNSPQLSRIELIRPGNINIIDQSADGSRLVTGATVYDKNLNLIGSLNPILNNFQLIAVTPDGNYAYILYYLDPYNWYDPAQQNVLAFKRYRIANDQGPYAAEDVSFSVDAGEYPLSMKISDDGKALFLLTSSATTNTRNFYVYPL